MQTLLAISLLCLLALCLAALAVARLVRITFSRAAKPSEQRQEGFAQYLAAAMDGRRQISPRSLRAAPHQTLQEVMAGKSWNQPLEVVTVRPDPEAQPMSGEPIIDPQLGARKLPQSSHRIGPERLDWAYFNKDLGDLTDPYEVPRLRANSRDNAPLSKRFPY